MSMLGALYLIFNPLTSLLIRETILLKIITTDSLVQFSAFGSMDMKQQSEISLICTLTTAISEDYILVAAIV